MSVITNVQVECENLFNYCSSVATIEGIEFNSVDDIWNRKVTYQDKSWWSAFIQLWQKAWLSCKSLVGFYIKKMYGKIEGLSGRDLEQEFQLVVANCLKKYKVSRGVRFSTYLYTACLHHVSDLHISRTISKHNVVAIPHYFKKFIVDYYELQHFGVRTGPMTVSEKAAVLGMTDVEYGLMVGLLDNDVPYPASPDSLASYAIEGDIAIRDPSLERFEVGEFTEWIISRIRQVVSERNFTIWGKCIGFIPLRSPKFSNDGKVFQASVADEYGLSRERVRQIFDKVNAKIKDILRDQLEIEIPDTPYLASDVLTARRIRHVF